MKKDAPEQTTVSGQKQPPSEYCPCYTYVDGSTDPDCPMHGRKGRPIETQQPLPVLLDEIEERATNARRNAPFETFAINVARTAADVPALVKALRRAIIDLETEAGLPIEELAISDDLAAILNQK